MDMTVLLSATALSVALLATLGSKWEIEKTVTIPAAIVIGLCSGLLTLQMHAFFPESMLWLVIVEVGWILSIAAALLLWRFYRDPERETPQDNSHAIISPADGKIIYVKKIEDGQIPMSEKKGRTYALEEFVQSKVLSDGGYIIGIAMNFLDVHVNRSPMSGTITLSKHIQGLFLSLKRQEALLQNERALTIIDNGHFKIGIVQIASRLVRQIVAYLHEGQEVCCGERMGMIRFGSQVDVVLPNLPSLVINVVPGMQVKAGLSLLASHHEAELS